MPTRGKKATKVAAAAAAQKNTVLDIGSLVQKIHENPGNAHLQIHSMLLLLEILSGPERPEFDTQKATRALILSIQTYPLQTELQRCACLCLWYIAQRSPPALKLLRTQEALAAVKENLTNHTCDVEVQYASFRVLVGIFLDPRNVEDSLRKYASECGIIKIIFDMLELHMKNSDIQFLGMTVLLLAWKTAMAIQIPTELAIGNTLKSMQIHRKNLLVQMSSCNLLHHLVNNNVQVVNEAWKQGVMKHVLRAFDSCLYANNSTFQQYVTKNIGVCHQSNREDELAHVQQCMRIIDQMYEYGAQPRDEPDLHVIAAAMAKYLQDTGLQELGINAIWKAMKRPEVSENIVHIGQHGIRAMLASMATLQMNQSVQLVAFECLNMFLDHSASNSALMIENNALNVVVRSMRLHQQNIFINLCGIRFLSLMSRGLDLSGRDAMVKSGCFGAVAAAILTDVEADKKRTVARYGCGCIRNMLLPDLAKDAKIRIVDEKTFPAILYAMDACKDNEEVQANGVYAMHMVFSDSGAPVTEYFNDMIPRVVSAMEFCKDDPYLQLVGCDTLRQILEFVAGRDLNFHTVQNLFASHNGLDATVFAASLYQGRFGAEIAAHVCGVIYYAAHEHVLNRRYFLEHNILTTLTEIMAFHKNDPSAYKSASLAYSLITQVSTTTSESRQNTNTSTDSSASGEGVPQQHGSSASPRDSKIKHCAIDGVKHHANSLPVAPAATGNSASVKSGRDSNSTATTCVDDSSTTGRRGPETGYPKSCDSGHVKRPVSGRLGEVCVACGKTCADVGMKQLLKCSGCTLAPKYCSAACQKECWPAHKTECKANRKAPK
jgi:hypothetical protein